MIAPKEGKDLKKQYKRLLIFIGVYFVIALCICYGLIKAGVHPVLNGFIIIVIGGIFYLPFLAICANIDKKKAAKAEKEKNRDPFTH